MECGSFIRWSWRGTAGNAVVGAIPGGARGQHRDKGMPRFGPTDEEEEVGIAVLLSMLSLVSPLACGFPHGYHEA